MVNGLRGARIGAIGTRPEAFHNVRFSETLLQASGIKVVTVDLSEILSAADDLPRGPQQGQDYQRLRQDSNLRIHQRDKCVVTHCSNYPRSFMGGDIEISELDVLGWDVYNHSSPSVG